MTTVAHPVMGAVLSALSHAQHAEEVVQQQIRLTLAALARTSATLQERFDNGVRLDAEPVVTLARRLVELLAQHQTARVHTGRLQTLVQSIDGTR